MRGGKGVGERRPGKEVRRRREEGVIPLDKQPYPYRSHQPEAKKERKRRSGEWGGGEEVGGEEK